MRVPVFQQAHPAFPSASVEREDKVKVRASYLPPPSELRLTNVLPVCPLAHSEVGVCCPSERSLPLTSTSHGIMICEVKAPHSLSFISKILSRSSCLY